MGGGNEICVRGEDDSENGTFGAFHAPMEDESSYSAIFYRTHRQKTWVEEDPSALGVV